ncbi:MAG: type II secretion system F family protein [Holosporales bacterium]|jgi:type IV pilus assembly protein PilC|nr:type II secretion system F family protein [Holosporales bacterium]
MPVYFYKAMNKAGNLTTGSIESARSENVDALLKQRGLTLIKINAHAPFMISNNSVNLSLFFEQLALLLNQKITLRDALDIMISTTNVSHVKRILAETLADMKQGHSFAEALARHSVFDSFVSDTIGRAEQTGNLEKTCAMLSQNFKTRDILQKQQKKAVVYPICVSFAILLFIVIALRVLIPNVRTFIGESATRSVVFALSDLSIQHPYLCMASVFGVFIGMFVGWRLVCPSLAKGTSSSGLLWLNGFAILLQSGISVKDALLLSMEQTKSSVLKKTIKGITQRVVSGEPLHCAMQHAPLIPDSTAKFAEIGESCGLLGDMLAQGAQLEMQLFIDKVQRRIALLQPALLTLFGVILIWLIWAIFVPIYDSLPAF